MNEVITLVSSCVLCLAGSAYADGFKPDASDSQRLLDEIVAGSDANFELIDHGRASYETIVYIDGQHSDTHLHAIHFDYPFLRADTANRVFIYKSDYVIDYRMPTGSISEYPAREHRAIIQDPTIASHPPFHPRVQNSPRATPHAGNIITAVRGETNGTISAQYRLPDRIEVRYENPSEYFRAMYLVAPQLGYSLTRIEEYALKRSDSTPYRELTMSYRRIPSGAYIVEHRHEIKRLSDGEKHSRTTEAVTRLVDFDPARPSPDVFRLESMGIPEGARIEDQINQRRYIFGVTAVTEEDIGVVEVTGPWRGTAPRRVLVIGTVVIGLVVLWFGVIRRRFRRQGSG